MKVVSIDIYKHPEKLEALAITIYDDLLKEAGVQSQKSKKTKKMT